MKPFVKWAGGKRQLLTIIKDKLPKHFNTYYEPFLAGGAVLLSIKPDKVIVGDINQSLINVYKQIKNSDEALMNLLDQYEYMHSTANNQKEFYLSMRDKYNQNIINKDYSLETSALFIYLNKTCFNGLYRVNSKGLFNVAFNNKVTVNLYEKENINEISNYLKQVEIYHQDFEETCKHAKKGDFVFLDSPYAPIKASSFEAYTKEGFSIDDHLRVAKVFKELTNKGVYCMLTNHCTDLILDLYKDYKIEIVEVRRSINSDASKRKGQEVIIVNY